MVALYLPYSWVSRPQARPYGLWGTGGLCPHTLTDPTLCATMSRRKHLVGVKLHCGHSEEKRGGEDERGLPEEFILRKCMSKGRSSVRCTGQMHVAAGQAPCWGGFVETIRCVSCPQSSYSRAPWCHQLAPASR